ncbi:MAG: DUF2066 domain-containing protein [Alphaproteobacteria bacterium]|nr:DUF2066 domain-containing protein [Alphaproteobacteria bacterium]MCB9984087.1 DUF2066 domain-containing protein [Micavibrio sp.]
MSRIVFSLVLISIFQILPLGHKAQAQTPYDPYVVTGVRVDVVDETSVKARDKAFVEAQEKAFRQLSERLGQSNSSNLGNLPSSEVLSGMVRDFEIENEQLSSKRYRGSFTIRFRESALNSYFGKNIGRPNESVTEGATRDPVVGSGEITSEKTLILPYSYDGDQAVLWDKDKNLLWQAFQRNANLLTTQFILPLGNISDQTDVWEKTPNLLSMSSIRKIRERYNVGDVVVVALRPQEKATPPMAMLDMYRTDQNRVALVKTIPVSMSVTSIEENAYINAAQLALNKLHEDWKQEQYRQQPYFLPETDTPQQPEISQQSIPQPIHPSKDTPSFSATGSAKIKTLFPHLQDWAGFQKFLKATPSLSSYKIKSVKAHEADIEVFYEDWTAFMAASASKGYRIQNMPDGTYQIYR